MHARPYTDVFNDNVAKVFQHYVKQYPEYSFVQLPTHITFRMT